MRKYLVFLAAGLSGLAVPACAEVVQKSEAGFVIRVTGEVAAPPAAAWNAFVSPAKWWSNGHTFSGEAVNLSLDPSANGCFCEKLPVPKDAPVSQRPGSVMHMRVLYAEPYRALRMTGGLGPLQSEAVTGTMTVTFKPVDLPNGKGTRILWEYVVGGYMRYKADTISGAVEKVLAEQLGSLVKLVGPLQAPVSGSASEGIAVSEIPSGENSVPAPDPTLDEAAAGESVKAALDKMFKKKEDAPPR